PVDREAILADTAAAMIWATIDSIVAGLCSDDDACVADSTLKTSAEEVSPAGGSTVHPAVPRGGSLLVLALVLCTNRYPEFVRDDPEFLVVVCDPLGRRHLTHFGLSGFR